MSKQIVDIFCGDCKHRILVDGDVTFSNKTRLLVDVTSICEISGCKIDDPLKDGCITYFDPVVN